MVDESNNDAQNQTNPNETALAIDTSQIDGNSSTPEQIPDDLTRILNDANPLDMPSQDAPSENMMAEDMMANAMPEPLTLNNDFSQETHSDGVVHIPPDGVQGDTLGDSFDMDSLINEAAQAVSASKTADILAKQEINITDSEIEHAASVQRVEPTVVPVPGFDIETTAMASVPLQIVAEIGNTELRIEQLMKIGRGAIIEIDKDVESNLELKIGHHLIGQGHLETDGEYFQIRVVNMIADIDEHHTLFYASNE